MWNRNEWAIFFVSLIFFALFTKAFVVGPNDGSRMGAIQDIVEHGTFSIDRSYFNGTIDKVFIHGHYYSDKPVMSYLIFVPVYFVLNEFGINLKTNGGLTYYLLTLLIIGVSVSAMLVFFFKLLERYALPFRTRLFYTAALGLGTLVMPYTLALNNHALTAAFLFISYYFMINAKSNKQYVFAGLLIGFTATLEIATGPIFFLVFTSYLFFKTKLKKTQWYILGATGPILVYLLINFIISGSIIPFQVRPELFQYPGTAFSNSGSLSGLAHEPLLKILNYAVDVTIGWKGFFKFTPMLLFSLAGLLFAVFQKNKFRSEAITALIGIICTFLFYITKTNNHGGCDFGFRFFVPVVPILFYFTPYLFKQKNAIPALKLLFLIAVMFSVYIAFMGIIQHPFSCDPSMFPNLNGTQILPRLDYSVSFPLLT